MKRFLSWWCKTSFRRSFLLFSSVFLGGLSGGVLMFILGINIEITSTFLPESLASVSFYVIYFLWAIALFKTVAFFSKKGREPKSLPKLEVRKVQVIRSPVNLN